MLKCGECHYSMMPEKVDLMDWEDTMPEMIRHAGLGRAKERAVLDCVIAVRAMHGLAVCKAAALKNRLKVGRGLHFDLDHDMQRATMVP